MSILDTFNQEMQSNTTTRSKPVIDYTLLPWKGILAIGEVLTLGAAKYPRNTWRKYSKERMVSGALQHLVALFAEYSSTEKISSEEEYEHIAHAATRMLLTLEIILQEHSNRTSQEEDNDE